jgi:Protein of unknown function (DUF3011)
MSTRQWFFTLPLALASCLALALPASARDRWRSGSDYEPSANRSASRIVRCESENYEYKYCPTPGADHVRLIAQLSETQCRRGQNWGYTNRGIWVDEGCTAEFRVTSSYDRRYGRNDDYGHDYRRRSGRDYGYLAGRRTVRCESENYEHKYCPAPVGDKVRLVAQLSETQCRRGQNWGYTNSGIWVDEGCAAEFQITSR